MRRKICKVLMVFFQVSLGWQVVLMIFALHSL